MKHAGSTVQIETHSLRVGMYIHLDVGWLSHPFPLSSFRLASQQQIAVIQRLGIRQVRWSPEQSSLLAPDLHGHAAAAPTPESAEQTFEPVAAGPAA